MASGKASQHRDRELCESLSQHGLDRDAMAPSGRVREVADDDPGDSIQRSGGYQRGQHTVHTVRRFAHVFDEKNGAVGKGKTASGGTREEHSEIPSNDRTSGCSSTPDGELLEPSWGFRELERTNPFRPASLVSPAEAGQVVGMQRGDSGALRFHM
jgi:hypothetical protein